MIENEFDLVNIKTVNFGVSLRPNADMYFVATDVETKKALESIFAETVAAFDSINGAWELYDISEDYGERRRIYVSRAEPLVADLSGVYNAGALTDLANISDHLENIDYYFSEFIDNNGRRIIGLKKATTLKRTLKSRHRLIRLVDDTLELIQEDVLRLDSEFDLLIAQDNIFILNVRPAEATAKIVEKVASAADTKVQVIHDSIPFLDLTRIKEKIGKHPRMARNAHSVAKRIDLALFNRDRILALSDKQGIKFTELPNGRLQCRVTDEAKLLELLDARRYQVDLIGDGGDPYRATGRQKVSAD